jgi:hypothetical protein
MVASHRARLVTNMAVGPYETALYAPIIIGSR